MFSLAFSVPSDVVNPTSANGSDFFGGGITNVVFNGTGISANGPSRVYFSIFDYGIYRSDGGGSYEQVTAIARDDVTGDLFVATDLGVNKLPCDSTTWVPAGSKLPPVAVYGLTIDSATRVLYAATHSRSAWKLKLDSSESE